MTDINQARAYGVRILPASVAPGRAYWRCVSVRHLTPNENRGKHNIYVDAIDSAGDRVRDPNVRIGWTWEGRRPNEIARPAPLDKSPAEPMGNIPLDWGQVMRVWIDSPQPSDAVEGMHSNHPDERGPNGEIWNSKGHHSFALVFQLTAQPVEPEPGPTKPPLSLEQRVEALEGRMGKVELWAGSFEGEL